MTPVPVTIKYRQLNDIPVVRLPLSKSIASRLLIISLLAGGDPLTLLPADEQLCDDLLVMRDATSRLFSLRNTGGKTEIDLKDSGTAKRLLYALCMSMPGITTTLKMSKRLGERNLGNLKKLLFCLSCGNEVTATPQSITIVGGKFLGLDLPIQVDTSRSSQTCSAIMLVAPTGTSPIQLEPNRLTVSKPYIEMTAALMRACGAKVQYDSKNLSIRITPGSYNIPDLSLLERDWSAAAFYYEYVLISGNELILKGLLPPGKSLQGDSVAVKLFGKLGVETKFVDEGVHLIPTGKLPALFYESMRDCPDLVPAIAVACAMKRIPFHIFHISHLNDKESERLTALSEGLALYGLKVNKGADSLYCDNFSSLHEPVKPVPVFADHRIAMAFAMTASCFNSLTLEDIGCVNKSFPGFREQLKAVGLLEI